MGSAPQIAQYGRKVLSTVRDISDVNSSDGGQNMVVVLAVTNKSSRLWKTGMDHDAKAQVIIAPERVTRRQFRTDRMLRGNKEELVGKRLDVQTIEYYEAIAAAIPQNAEVLLIGHGNGKASAAVKLREYLKKKHHLIEEQIVDELDENLIALTDNEVLALSRDWFNRHRVM